MVYQAEFNNTKEYYALFYGIDVSLSDDEFYKKIDEINKEAEEVTKRFNNKGLENI